MATLLALPAFANDTDAAQVAEQTTDAVVAETTDTVVADAAVETPAVVAEPETTVSNPKAKFPHGLELGLGVSATSGVNGFVGYANKNFDSFWWKRLGVRFDFASTSPIKSSINNAIEDVIGDGIELGDDIMLNSVTLKSHHAAAMIDFYPFGNTWFLGGWRLTGGYYFGEMKINAALSGTIEDAPDAEFAFELGDNQYRYKGNQVNGGANMKWDFKGPYLGTGFDFGLFCGVKIYLDAGVIFTNKAAQLNIDVDPDNLEQWNGTDWVNITGSLADDWQEAKEDALKDAQDELDKYKFYPMVKMGFMYRF